jgi:aspartyl-tRNA(Asn)/glutamyl-tRNA(Gln) amidotransferase subunit C
MVRIAHQRKRAEAGRQRVLPAASSAVGSIPALCYTRGVASNACAEADESYFPMPVDADTVRRVAHLARVAVAADEVENLQAELNSILAFVEQLAEVKVDGVEPMTSVTPMAMKARADVVSDGGIPDGIIANAPAHEDHFFLVPKVVE